MMTKRLNYEPNIIFEPKILTVKHSCKILTDYARELHRKNEISRELYAEFVNYIISLCLEQMVEAKFNEIIPKWSKRFDNWFYPNNVEEAT